MTDERWFERDQQLPRARALLDMLVKADADKLPPMQWLVNAAAGSCLHGETDGVLDHTPEATFTAWVEWLGLKPGKPYINSIYGRREQRAGGTYRFDGRDVPIGILMVSNEQFEE